MGQVKLVETAIGYGTIVGDFSYLTWKLEHIEVKLMAQYGELNGVKWGKWGMKVNSSISWDEEGERGKGLKNRGRKKANFSKCLS